jgi:hypothetical protein
VITTAFVILSRPTISPLESCVYAHPGSNTLHTNPFNTAGIAPHHIGKGKIKMSGSSKAADGANTILIDSELVRYLQKIRDHFNVSVTINSAYRTVAHNQAVGGSPNSKHTTGQAADSVVKNKSQQDVAKYTESIGILGIGKYGLLTREALIRGLQQAIGATVDGKFGTETASNCPTLNLDSVDTRKFLR